MPRKKKVVIGSRRKGYSKRGPKQRSSALSDHSYSSVQTTVLDDCRSRDTLWDRAWKSFFIALSDEPTDDPCQEATDSDGCSADEFFVILDKVHQYHPDNNVDEFVVILQYHRYQQYLKMKKELLQHVDELGNFTIARNQRENITIVQFYDSDLGSVQLSVVIKPSFTATIYAHRRDIGPNHEFWIGLPTFFSTLSDVKKLLSKLSTYHVCVGNYEDRFADMVPVGAGISKGAISTISAYREGDFGANINGIAYTSTIRSMKCQFLVSQRDRCSHCSKYRATLRANARRDAVKQNFSQIKVIGSSVLQPICGNISSKRPHTAMTVDDTALPRRKQKRV
ncbi:uncharacterized protein [Haliotis asinina]|uniref:uncharacterized protein n=1 Tax=Haliotis asinina TaxID=109174 RepID=UPI003532302E